VNQDTNNWLVKVFRDVNDMLANAEEIILKSRSHSPFNDFLTQLSAEQSRTVGNGIAELRTAMICILRQRGIVTNNPTIQTADAVRRTITAAASRLEVLLAEQADGTISAIDGEASRLLLQMKSDLVKMDRALSTSQSDHRRGSESNEPTESMR
jgi:hypothetical protein